jgi:hypothetical protein
MQSVWVSDPLFFIMTLFVLVALLLPTRQRRRRGRAYRRQHREALRSSGAPRTNSRRRRPNLATDEEWRAFREVKAGITGQKGEAAVVRQLAHLGASALHDVILEDSRGLTQIDHLVLGLDAILVLETKTFSGFIAGGLHSQEWTQYLAQDTTRTNFQNPLRQNYRHCAATVEIVGDPTVLVRGYVVSAGKARFSDTLAGFVVDLDNLADILVPDDSQRADRNALRLAWERLTAAAQAGEARRAKHLADVRAKRGLAA